MPEYESLCVVKLWRPCYVTEQENQDLLIVEFGWQSWSGLAMGTLMVSRSVRLSDVGLCEEFARPQDKVRNANGRLFRATSARESKENSKHQTGIVVSAHRSSVHFTPNLDAFELFTKISLEPKV